MENTLVIYLSVITFFFAFLAVLAITFEWYLSSIRKLNLYSKEDFKMNIKIGVVAALLQACCKGWVLASWFYFYHLSVFQFETSIIVLLEIFILNEFVYYWYHRLSHRVPILWAVHVNHHSSPYFNFSTAARNAVFGVFFKNAFLCILPILGYHPLACLFVHVVCQLLTFFQHTQLKFNFGLLAWILNTPSHHKVHHGRNEAYKDKNFGQVLIIFDRMFGTFAEEKDEAIFGVDEDLNQESIWSVVFHKWIEMYHEFFGSNLHSGKYNNMTKSAIRAGSEK